MTRFRPSHGSQRWGVPRPVQYGGLAVMVVVTLALAVAALVSQRMATTDEATGPSQPVESAERTEAPIALWFGDSYTAGTGAADQSTAESCASVNALGWRCGVDAQGGTGFVNNGRANNDRFQPLGLRLETTVEVNPEADYVIVDAGRNDGRASWPEVRAAASNYFSRLDTLYPDAEMVVIVPYFMNGSTPVEEFADFARTEMEKYDGHVIDPVAEGWVSRETVEMTIDDRIHPNQDGHRYLANNLRRRFVELGFEPNPDGF